MALLLAGLPTSWTHDHDDDITFSVVDATNDYITIAGSTFDLLGRRLSMQTRIQRLVLASAQDPLALIQRQADYIADALSREKLARAVDPSRQPVEPFNPIRGLDAVEVLDPWASWEDAVDGWEGDNGKA